MPNLSWIDEFLFNSSRRGKAIPRCHTIAPYRISIEAGGRNRKKKKKNKKGVEKKKKDLPDPFGSPLASDESFRSFLTAALSADFDGPADAAALASFTLSSSRHG